MEVGENAVKRFGDYRLDTNKRALYKGDEPISLMPKAFDMLCYLVENNARVIGKDELLEAVWPDTIVEESNLSQNISILRKVLGEKPAENRFIATVPGRGYKFVADVASDPPVVYVPAPSASGHDSPPDKRPARELPGGNSRFLIFGAVTGLCVALLLVGFYWYRNSRSDAKPAGSVRTIAILPFKPLAQNERDETLELGMADTLISKLGDSPELIVRPLSSVRRFSAFDQDALEAGRQLGVEAVLDGSIQRSGDTIRVNVRLLGTDDGSAIWSAIYDEPASDIFKLQDAISSRVAGALRIRLGKARAPYTSNLDAYRLYMTGRLQVLRATRPELLQGIRSFRLAIELDPNYALAYAGMADAYRTLALGGELRPSEVFPEARAAAQRAVQLDDSLAEAHTVLGSTLFWCDWDWPGAEERFKRALQLNPNIADTHSEYAFLLSNVGRHEEALVMIRTALELDPLNRPNERSLWPIPKSRRAHR
jgi:DNA-binding winged helix-turn-helix (wHTH) protein/TolB-like protein